MGFAHEDITRYRNRREAGEALAERLLERYGARQDLLILALPRGGVPVAAEIAWALQAPLDLMLVRKLGLPGHEELAMGAIATGGVRVLNEQVVSAMSVSDEMIQTVAEEERRELRRREQAYRDNRPEPRMEGRTVVLVDDGLATGSTMQAAIDAVKQMHAAAVVVAIPVAPPDTAWRMSQEVDDFICPLTPPNFMSVGQHYDQFDQTTDDEVRQLLSDAWSTDRPTDAPPPLRPHRDPVSAHDRRDD